MKRFACILALSFRAHAAEPSAAAGKAVANAEKEWTAAVLKGDTAAIEKLMAPDLSYTHSSAKTQTRDDFLHDISSGATKYKSIEFENTKMRQYGSTIVVTHSVTITSVPGGSSHLYLTEVWAEQGHWQMVSRQATKIP